MLGEVSSAIASKSMVAGYPSFSTGIVEGNLMHESESAESEYTDALCLPVSLLVDELGEDEVCLQELIEFVLEMVAAWSRWWAAARRVKR